MDALIDSVLESILHSVIWRSTWYLDFKTLIIIGVIAFIILAWRRSSRSKNNYSKRAKNDYKKRNIWRK